MKLFLVNPIKGLYCRWWTNMDDFFFFFFTTRVIFTSFSSIQAHQKPRLCFTAVFLLKDHSMEESLPNLLASCVNNPIRMWT